MRRYRNFIIDLIRLSLLVLFVYILPTRLFFNKIMVFIFNITNIWFFILAKVPITIILFYIFTFIDEHNLYNKYALRDIFRNRPIHSITLIVSIIEIILSIVLFSLDKTNLMQISSGDWLGYINNILVLNITLLVGLFALYEYLEKKEKEGTPDIVINLENSIAPAYKAYLNSNISNENGTTISINMKSNHSIKKIEFQSYYSYSQIHSVSDNTILETLNKDIPVYVYINFINSDKSYYDLVVYTENYERFIIPFTIIHKTQYKEQYQINQDKIRKER